jgi:hypothetical protein
MEKAAAEFKVPPTGVDGLPSRNYWPPPIDPALSGSPPSENLGDKICDRIAATHLPVRYFAF